MKTNKIKWDEGMAVRCVKRVNNGFIPVHVSERNATRSFQKGEWDEFSRKITREIRKQN